MKPIPNNGKRCFEISLWSDNMVNEDLCRKNSCFKKPTNGFTSRFKLYYSDLMVVHNLKIMSEHLFYNHKNHFYEELFISPVALYNGFIKQL